MGCCTAADGPAGRMHPAPKVEHSLRTRRQLLLPDCHGSRCRRGLAQPMSWRGGAGGAARDFSWLCRWAPRSGPNAAAVRRSVSAEVSQGDSEQGTPQSRWAELGQTQHERRGKTVAAPTGQPEGMQAPPRTGRQRDGRCQRSPPIRSLRCCFRAILRKMEAVVQPS